MNRNLAATLFAVAGGLGYLAGATGTGAGPNAPRVTLVNAKFVRAQQSVVLPDGGRAMQESWLVRACGYLMPSDGGTQQVAEPCWDEFVSQQDFAPIEKLLVYGDAGL